MVTLGKKSQPRGCSKIAISSGFRIVDDISGLGGRNTGGLPYKGPPIWLQTVATIIASVLRSTRRAVTFQFRRGAGIHGE